MNVILSRKGFDDENGGYPSVILPKEMGYKMISFPIPEANPNGHGKKAEELNYILDNGETINLKILFDNLGISPKIKVSSKPPRKGLENTVFHFDPEVQRVEGGRNIAAFGQREQATSLLKSKKIGKDDVFLFFGTFRKTCLENGKIIYAPGTQKIHALWGYMIVDNIFNVNENNDLQESLKTHVHYLNRRLYHNNIIITGSHFGTFNFDKKYQLTKQNNKRSCWELPDCFNGKYIPYSGMVENPAEFNVGHRGQEFVINNDDGSLNEWLQKLF